MAKKPDWLSPDEFRQAVSDGTVADAILRKGFTLDKLESMDEPRRIRFVISTGDVDRDNDTIDPAGWELANFKANPVILWAHSQRDLPVGRAVEIGVESGKLVAVAEFATHPFAETVLQLLKNGFLRATSVGFRALEYAINEERRGVDFKRQELLEFSVVPVPANQNALMAASAAGVDLEPLRKWIADILSEWPGELKLPGKAWEKVLGAAAKHVGAPGTGEVVATVKVDSTQLDAAIEKVNALIGRLAEVLAALDEQQEEQADSPSRKDDEVDDDLNRFVLELADEPEGFEIDTYALRDGLREAIGATFGAIVRESTERELNRIRGRVD